MLFKQPHLKGRDYFDSNNQHKMIAKSILTAVVILLFLAAAVIARSAPSTHPGKIIFNHFFFRFEC